MSESIDKMIANWLESAENGLRPKCHYCGAKLNYFWDYLHGSEMQKCKSCGKIVIKKE